MFSGAFNCTPIGVSKGPCTGKGTETDHTKALELQDQRQVSCLLWLASKSKRSMVCESSFRPGLTNKSLLPAAPKAGDQLLAVCWSRQGLAETSTGISHVGHPRAPSRFSRAAPGYFHCAPGLYRLRRVQLVHQGYPFWPSGVVVLGLVRKIVMSLDHGSNHAASLLGCRFNQSPTCKDQAALASTISMTLG